MGIAFEHLHRLVAADGRNFLIRKPSLRKSADGLVAKIMKTYVSKSDTALYVQPNRIELIGMALAVLAGFAIEDEVSVDGA